jgi:hypothetical protein
MLGDFSVRIEQVIEVYVGSSKSDFWGLSLALVNSWDFVFVITAY